MIFLSIGSNLGDRAAFLAFAVRQLQQAGVEILAESSIYETPPWGKEDQPGYLNQVLKIAYNETPFQLLQMIREIENRAGRQRSEKWGPRTLDIDIIEFNRMQISEPLLTLPHPHYTQRLFVLVPLAECAPLWMPTGSAKTVTEWIKTFSASALAGVVKWSSGND